MNRTILGVLVLITSNANAQDIERINPAGMTQPTAYTHLVKGNNLMFIAGQVSADADGNVVGRGDMAAQLRQVLENLRTILESEDADFRDIVKITIFTTDIDAFFDASEIRREYFGSHAAASTLVQVERLARTDFLVEIEAIAIVPD